MIDPSIIQTGIQTKPLRVLIYGVPGCGKSTWAAAANNSLKTIFIPTEDGCDELDVAKFPKAKTWAEVLDYLAYLYEAEHDYKVVVLDSITATEQLIRNIVAKEYAAEENEPEITFEKIPWGKGYKRAAEKVQTLMNACDALRNKGMQTILIGHSGIKPFHDICSADQWDQYKLSCHEQIASPIIAWADCVFFVNYDRTAASVGEGFKKRTIGRDAGRRIMFTECRATHEAKCRVSRLELKEKEELNGRAFWERVCQKMNF
ncbi:ATP-binding protein [Shewanella sp. KX20019]|uniref:ATP-binding protein n=1 Tax=Shewanella sp. KX20019 TaxID=2803864 RepID=UPI001926746E|nr:ATP-binding protein [Shewanella sp. KX20019]QQX80833.1 ATP-binding protein [Shewanella sp. KX20019]